MYKQPATARRQPSQLPKVSRKNKISRGLICALSPFQRIDAVDGGRYVQEGNYERGYCRAGVGLVTDGSVSNIYRGVKPITLTRWTLFGLFRSNGNAVDTRALSLGSSVDNNPILQIGSDPSDPTKVRVWARDDSAVTPAATTSSASAFDGNLHTIAITYDGSNISCYIDGKFDSSVLWFGSTTVDRFCVGALYRASAVAFWSGLTIVGACWSRDLSAVEVWSLYENPFQIFQQTTDNFFVDAISAGGNDVSPGTGSIQITGYSPTVNQTANQSVQPGTGSLAITGYAPTVTATANQSVSPGTGAIQITGYAPTVEQAAGSQSVSPGTGQITITGYAPVVSQASAQQFSGGYFELPRVSRKKSVQEEREELGIIPRKVQKVISDVVKRSVTMIKTDSQAIGLLELALKQSNVLQKPEYQQYFTQQRDKMLKRDIARSLLIQQRQKELLREEMMRRQEAEDDELSVEMLLL